MESYLMMLYVTLDQESALKSFFIDQGWNFLKPDLSVITDKIGPVKSINTRSTTPARATFPAETDKVSASPENTLHKVNETVRLSPDISGNPDIEPSNSRKRHSKSMHTEHPVAKVPKLNQSFSTGSISASLSEKPQPEFLVQLQDDNIAPNYVNSELGVTVKVEAVDSDSDNGPEYDDVDDNENTDEAEESHEVLAGNGVNNASYWQNVTEGNWEEETKPKQSPKSDTERYRSYSLSALTNAYNAAFEGIMSISKAAKLFGVPKTTLRDLVRGKVGVSKLVGHGLMALSPEREAEVVEHLNTLSSKGYLYTKQDVCAIAADYSMHLGKRTVDSPLSMRWCDKFQKRWPDLLIRKHGEGKERAKRASVETINSYFDEMQQVLKRYNLDEKPHLIFNVAAHTITFRKKSLTTTVLGCGSASGTALPPFFIFSGKRMSTELMKGASPGAAGAVSETGYPSAKNLRQYLQEHFIKFVPQTEQDQHILLLIDGRTPNVPVGVLDWAKENRIILLIFPAYTSYTLQPLNVACYGPFRTIYNCECEQLLRQTSAAVTRLNICELLCRVYSRALSEENLRTAFSKTGIFPFSRDVNSEANVTPAKVFHATEVATEEMGVQQFDLVMEVDENPLAAEGKEKD